MPAVFEMTMMVSGRRPDGEGWVKFPLLESHEDDMESEFMHPMICFREDSHDARRMFWEAQKRQWELEKSHKIPILYVKK